MELDQGNTAFLLIAAALVLLMTPGLAFFYGGLVKAKSVISMMMMSFGAMGLIGVLWVLYGYAITFSNDVGWDGVFGIDFSQIGLQGVYEEALNGDFGAYPTIAFAAFQATFAIITVALISGAIADRAKFGAWMIFAGIWATIVYFPVASWVFNFTLGDDGSVVNGGWIASMGVIDFAGGTAVHINAGAAALALALVLGKRVGFAKGAHVPHNPPFVLLGAGLLWFGWFGFNAGSELAADGVAAIAFLNTIAAAIIGWSGDGVEQRDGCDTVNAGSELAADGVAAIAFLNTIAAPAAAIIGWLIVEKLRDGKPTSVGAASGAVAGLVAITPACAALSPFWAIVLGVVAGAVCALAIDLKFRLGFDDSLDVVGIHLVGGLIGTLYVGIFATSSGLAFGYGFGQLWVQFVAAAAVLVYSFVLAWVIAFVIQKTIGFRITNEDELAGVDTAVHGEEGYVLADAR